MKKIIYDDETYLYLNFLNFNDFKDELLIKCNEIIENNSHVLTDNYTYFTMYKKLDFIGKINIKNKIDEILDNAIKTCIKIYAIEYNLQFNRIDADCWVNVVRAKNPVQDNFKNPQKKYHSHTLIEKKLGNFTPHFTWVYYIQMPDNLKENDGVLFFLGKNDEECFILPKEGEIIVMSSDLQHSPNHALNSTKDRIVLAGNVGFEYIKNNKSLI